MLLLNGKQISPLEIGDTFEGNNTLNKFQILLDYSRKNFLIKLIIKER